MNSVNLIGRLVRNIEIKKTNSGISVAQFTLAVNKYTKDEEHTADFINCVAWRTSAEFLGMYAHKGNTVSVSGRLSTRTYEKKDGSKAYITEVVCSEVNLLNTNRNEYKEKEVEKQDNIEISPDDLPF